MNASPLLGASHAGKAAFGRAVGEGAWTGAVAGLLLLYGVAAGFLMPPYPDPGGAVMVAVFGAGLAAAVGAAAGGAVACVLVALFLVLPGSIRGPVLASRRSTAVTLVVVVTSAVLVGVAATAVGVLLFSTRPMNSDQIRFVVLVGWPVVAVLWRVPVAWKRFVSRAAA